MNTHKFRGSKRDGLHLGRGQHDDRYCKFIPDSQKVDNQHGCNRRPDNRHINLCQQPEGPAAVYNSRLLQSVRNIVKGADKKHRIHGRAPAYIGKNHRPQSVQRSKHKVHLIDRIDQYKNRDNYPDNKIYIKKTLQLSRADFKTGNSKAAGDAQYKLSCNGNYRHNHRIAYHSHKINCRQGFCIVCPFRCQGKA